MDKQWMFPLMLTCSCGGEIWKKFTPTEPEVKGKAAKAHGTEGVTTDECRSCGKTSYPVDAGNFMVTLHVNVDNPRLSDADFREFVRNSLPVVDYVRPVTQP